MRKLHVIGINVGIFILTRFALELSSLPTQGKNTVAIAALMAALWVSEAIPIAITALLPLVLFPAFGILPSKAVGPNYGNHLIFLFMGGFMIASAVQRWGLHERIALNIARAIGTNPKKLTLSLMTATALLSMWISNTATTMMMFPIATAIVIAGGINFGTADPKRFGCLLLLSVAYGASLGGIATIIGTPPNVVMAGVIGELTDGHAAVSFANWLIFALPLAALLIVIFWLLMTRIFFKDVLAKIPSTSKANTIRENLARLGPMSTAERRVMAIFVSAAALWIFRADINLGYFVIKGWANFFPEPKHIHDATVAMALGCLLFAVPSGNNDKTKLMNWDYFKQSVPWGILILFGGGFALADGLKASGVIPWIADVLSPFAGLPPFAILLTTCLLVSFLTEVTSNTATATALLPIIAPVGLAFGIEPLMLIIPATLACSFAFMLPVATPPNAIVFASDWIRMRDMAKVGFFLNIVSALITSMYTQMFAGRIFGF